MISWAELAQKEYEKPEFILDPYIPAGGIVLLWGDTSIGKSNNPKDLALMHTGHVKEVGDLRIGDVLMGPDGKPRIITHLRTGVDEMYRITPARGGDSWSVNSRHILTLLKVYKRKPHGSRKVPGARSGALSLLPEAEQRLVDVPIQEYLKWGRVKKKQHQLKRVGVEFSEKVLPLDPRLLGILLGDGSIGFGTPMLTSVDQEIADYTRKAVAILGDTLRQHQDPKNFGICGTGTRDVLKTLGLDKANSERKFIPHEYKTGSRHQRLEILAGLIDTDGHKGPTSYDFISKSKQLTDDVVFIARSLGFCAETKECQKTCQTGATGTYYRTNISGPVDEIKPLVPRKRFLSCPKHEDPKRTSFKVESVGRGDYVSFTFGGQDPHFLMGDFTISHNSPVTWQMAKSIGAGSHFFGLPCRQGRVLYLEMDTPELSIAPRIKKLQGELPPNIWWLFTKPLGLPMLSNEEREALGQAQEEVIPDVVFVNTLRKAHDLNDIESRTPKIVYSFFQKAFPQAALVFTHHERKKGTDPNAIQHDKEGFSGSKHWLDDAQVGLHLERFRGEGGQENLKLYHRKSQVSDLLRPLPLKLDTDGSNLSSPLFDQLLTAYEFLNSAEAEEQKAVVLDDMLGRILRISAASAKRLRLIVMARKFPGSREFLEKHVDSE